VEPSPTLLFRYSALTFNSHRIHYDRDHATQVEGYPGLVVHGPLLATLLLDLVRRELPAGRVAAFSFRAMQPLYDTTPFFICGARDAGPLIHLWAEDEAGFVATAGTARLL
jgi:3-methylfumaryl-CoA hydratase